MKFFDTETFADTMNISLSKIKDLIIIYKSHHFLYDKQT